MVKLQAKIDMLKMHDQQFDKVQNKLKELENIECAMLPKLYNYKEKMEKEVKDEA